MYHQQTIEEVGIDVKTRRILWWRNHISWQTYTVRWKSGRLWKVNEKLSHLSTWELCYHYELCPNDYHTLICMYKYRYESGMILKVEMMNKLYVTLCYWPRSPSLRSAFRGRPPDPGLEDLLDARAGAAKAQGLLARDHRRCDFYAMYC